MSRRKPLMRYLCRLITPPGGLILDPFAGSGTTGVAAKLDGFRAILIEQDAEWMPVMKARLGWAVHEPTLFEVNCMSDLHDLEPEDWP